MKIEHIAIWTDDIEQLTRFYEAYFEAKSGEKYINESKQFQSCFLTFNSGARLEIMKRPGVSDHKNKTAEYFGYAHIAISVGSEEKVDNLTDKLMKDGYKIVDGPRTTGDGYYESVVMDPDGNRVEITV